MTTIAVSKITFVFAQTYIHMVALPLYRKCQCVYGVYRAHFEQQIIPLNDPFNCIHLLGYYYDDDYDDCVQRVMLSSSRTLPVSAAVDSFSLSVYSCTLNGSPANFHHHQP